VSYAAWRPLSLTPAHSRRALGFFLAHLMVFVVAFSRMGRRDRSRRFAFLIAAIAGCLSIVGILQNVTGGTKIYWWRSAGPNYFFGPFVNANNFAGWMELALPLCAGLAVMVMLSRNKMSGRSGPLDQGGQAFAGFVLLAFVTIIGLAAFLMTRSRGGVLAFSAAIAVYLVLQAVHGALRWRAVLAAALTVLLALALVSQMDWPALRDKYGDLADVERDPSFRSRIEFTRGTIKLASDFPVLGTGLGTFQEAFALYTPGTSDRVLRRAHNDYAQVAAETGIPGAILVLWGLFVLLGRGVIPGLRRRGSSFRWAIHGAAVGLLALLLHSLVDFNLQIYSNSVLFAFLCAFVIRDHRDHQERLRRSGR
jgi:O-antigen ligase